MAADIGIMHDEIIRDEENVIGDPIQVVIDSKPNDLKFPRWKAIILLICIIAATIVIWVFSATTYQQYMPQKVSLLIIAWTLGLRHALDADHIAAIDNVTRRFTQDGHSYVAVGTFFSLGHSTIVVIATILIAAFSTAISTGFSQYHGVSGYIGSAISATFLLLIATINGTSMVLIARDLRKERDRAQQAAVTANNDGAGNHDEEGGMNWDTILENSGFFTRVFGKRLFRLIDAPWKMYFVGLLFGLGFDTATEVALLSIAALQAVTGSTKLIITNCCWLLVVLLIISPQCQPFLSCDIHSHITNLTVISLFPSSTQETPSGSYCFYRCSSPRGWSSWTHWTAC